MHLSVCKFNKGVARPASGSDANISAFTQLQRTQFGSAKLVLGCDRCLRVAFGRYLNAD